MTINKESKVSVYKGYCWKCCHGNNLKSNSFTSVSMRACDKKPFYHLRKKIITIFSIPLSSVSVRFAFYCLNESLGGSGINCPPKHPRKSFLVGYIQKHKCVVFLW